MVAEAFEKLFEINTVSVYKNISISQISSILVKSRQWNKIRIHIEQWWNWF